MCAFGIKEMFCDVEQPLSQLTEIQRLQHEEREQKHDRRTNSILIVLSLLTIVSALTDALGITSNIDWLISTQLSHGLQLGVAAAVLCVSIIMLVRLIFLRNKE